MRLSDIAHLPPWRIHELTRDFWLEYVWALPKQGGPDDFSRLVGRNDAEGMRPFGLGAAPDADLPQEEEAYMSSPAGVCIGAYR